MPAVASDVAASVTLEARDMLTDFLYQNTSISPTAAVSPTIDS